MKYYFSKHFFIFLASIVVTLLYMIGIVPDIEKPLTIVGFFLCISSVLFSLQYLVFSIRFRKYPVVLLSGIGTLSTVYLIALRTIGSLDLIDVAIVVVVVTLMVQLLVLQKKR